MLIVLRHVATTVPYVFLGAGPLLCVRAAAAYSMQSHRPDLIAVEPPLLKWSARRAGRKGTLRRAPPSEIASRSHPAAALQRLPVTTGWKISVPGNQLCAPTLQKPARALVRRVDMTAPGNDLLEWK
jgi:hypothetical protein